MDCSPGVALPSEIWLNVLAFQSSISDVLAFSASCRRLRSLWNLNYRTISAAVFRREFHSYAGALQYAETQEATEQCATNSAEFWTEVAIYPVALRHVRRMLIIASDSSRISDLYEAYAIPSALACKTIACHNYGHRLLPRERARFLRAYYFCSTYALTLRSVHASKEPLVKQRQRCETELEHANSAEAQTIWEVSFWLCDILDYREREKLGIEDPDPPEELFITQQDFPFPEWDAARKSITESWWNKTEKPFIESMTQNCSQTHWGVLCYAKDH